MIVTVVVVGEADVRRLRILLIDDNIDYVEMLAELLRAAGHCVLTAHDGGSGVTRFEAFKPDLAILDLGLPGVDGFALARTVRCSAQFSKVALIAISAPADRERSAESGFDHHLAKPPDWSALERLIVAYASGAA
jgi:DNA-binding response OmpR family regulator